MTKQADDRQSEPISFRIPNKELYFYRQEADRLRISITALILAALRDKYFPDESEDDYWYGHA